MSWASSLCALYDANAWRAGEVEMWNGKPLILIPLGYDTMEAQVEIAISSSGSFVSARKLEKSEAETLVPYPEGRTRGEKALPLFDKLIYIADDYERFVKANSEKAQRCHKLFVDGLKAWCDSDYSHRKAQSIFTYISKGNVIKDLVDCSVFQVDIAGLLDEKVKIQGVAQPDVFIRFRVYGGSFDNTRVLSDMDNKYDSAVWLDKTVHEQFLRFYMSSENNAELCYLSGEHMRFAKATPVKIRNKGDQTRLISSNDGENFTYRGRFMTKVKDSGYNEAMSIGYETSQKIHSALRWIIRRQGYMRDGVCIVSWESALNDMPRYYDGAIDILNAASDDIDEIENTGVMLFDEPETERQDTNYVSAQDFNLALDGYSTKLNDISTMVVLALDSVSKKGRLAMTYYKELATSRYLDNIRVWQESCCWRHEYFKENHFCRYEGMASLSETAKAVYGTEQNKRLTLRANSEGKCPMLIFTFDRLRPCIMDRAAIPRDIVCSAVEKASNPLAYEMEFNYLCVLHIACSLVKRYYWEKGVVFNMKLDEKCTDRSYLFGRLLAVAEKVERSTFERDETRTTNAERYMQQFSRTPFRTWMLIRRSTQIHLKQLRPGSREYYKNLYGEIADLFGEGAFEEKEALNGKFLLGYDCQRIALKLKENDSAQNVEEEHVHTEEEEN